MKKIAILFLLFFAFPAASEEAPEQLNMALKYEAFWSGISLGEMKIYLKTGKDEYDYKVRLDSSGFTKMITKYWSENTVSGKIKSNKFIPQKYNTEWRLKKEKQKIQVNYDSSGNALEEIAEPPENRDKRPFVELKDKKAAYDTITAAAVARQKISAIVKIGKFPAEFSVPLFDARRKQDIAITVSGYEDRRINNEKQKVLHMVFKRIPGPGFRDKELTRMKTQEPIYDVYLNDKLIPLLIIGKAPVGTATITLQKICDKPDCDLD